MSDTRTDEQIVDDRMLAWACVNAILRYLNEPEAPFGEFRDAANCYGLRLDAVKITHTIRRWRLREALGVTE